MGFREDCVASLLPPICNATGNAKEACWVDATSAMGENYYNKRWPCSSKTWFCSSRCMESSLLLNWAYIFALTLSVLLTSEAACSSLQVMSWFPLSYHHLMNGPLPCHVGFQMLFCSLFAPTQKISPVVAPCFLLLGSLMVEPRTNSHISVLTGKVNQACISRWCIICISLLFMWKYWIIVISSLV